MTPGIGWKVAWALLMAVEYTDRQARNELRRLLWRANIVFSEMSKDGLCYVLDTVFGRVLPDGQD